MSASPLAVKIMQLDHGSDLPLPAYQSELASGVDLYAAIGDEIDLKPGKRAMIPTGISLEMPHNMEAQIRPRSGLAAKSGISVLNTPGTIDADYRGEIKVILINLGEENFVITHGMRIAQMIFQPVLRVDLTPAQSLSETERGSGGFGSSGSFTNKKT